MGPWIFENLTACHYEVKVSLPPCRRVEEGALKLRDVEMLQSIYDMDQGFLKSVGMVRF